MLLATQLTQLAIVWSRAGLAHFLEHMLFLGTAKYPDEDDYTTFLAQNGDASSSRDTARENGRMT